MGIIITEPKRERGKIRRRRGTRMKRVPSRGGFTLRCHRHDKRKQKERKRKERQSEKFQAIKI